VKPGTRALGIAESYRGGHGTDGTAGHSTLVGCVMSANGVVDDFVVGSCTVGGTDATEAVISMVDRLDRPDIQYLFIAGIAPAWFNILDIEQIAERIDCPTLSVSFAESDGLEPALRRELSERTATARIETYRRQPTRHRIQAGTGSLFVRAAGDIDSIAEVVRAFCSEGETSSPRPEPLRVAQLAARGVDNWRRTEKS